MPDKMTDQERSLLAFCLEKYKPNLLSQVPVLDSDNVNDDLVEKMIDAVSSELMAKGFLKGDKESHKYGKELETLIDKLVDVYLRPAKGK